MLVTLMMRCGKLTVVIVGRFLVVKNADQSAKNFAYYLARDVFSQVMGDYYGEKVLWSPS